MIRRRVWIVGHYVDDGEHTWAAHSVHASERRAQRAASMMLDDSPFSRWFVASLPWNRGEGEPGEVLKFERMTHVTA